MTNDKNQLTITMPKLGLTMTEATLTEWRTTEGISVNQGDILFEFESDKSVMEFEAPTNGVLAQILIAEGETVPCGTPLAVMQVAGSKVASSRAAEEQGHQVAEPQGNDTQQSALHPSSLNLQPSVLATPAAKRRARELNVELTSIAGRGPQNRVQLADVEQIAAGSQVTTKTPVATPLAKRMASALDVDLTQVSGSGPGGRVVKEDVLQAVQPEQQTPALPDEVYANVQSLTGVRSVIAQRMSDSAFTAPHVTLFTEADASALVEARNQLNTELAGIEKISYNTLLIAMAARALRDHPHLNACLIDDEIKQYGQINIALAVDTERGLLVPVIRNADTLDLVSIQKTGDTLIQRALAGKSQPDDLTGGTFTLTNLGMFDIDGFTPIINQPQAAILGVGRILAKPVVAANGEIASSQMMALSLSFDHRIVDGGPAARFLQRVKQLIERPFALALPVGG